MAAACFELFLAFTPLSRNKLIQKETINGVNRIN